MQKFIAFSVATTALLALSASAQTNNCSDAAKAAQKQLDVVKDFVAKDNFKFKTDGRKYVARYWGKDYDKAEKLLAERKKAWGQVKQNYGLGLTSASKAVQLWDDAGFKCSGNNNSWWQAFSTGPRKELQAKLQYIFGRYLEAACIEALESIDVPAYLLEQQLRADGLSEALYDKAKEYGFDEVKELRAKLGKNCGLDKLPKGSVVARAWSAFYSVSEAAASEIVEPYEKFVLNEVDSEDRSSHEEEFERYIMNQTLNGYLSTVSLLLERGNYEMPLDSFGTRTTLLMEAVKSANDGPLVKYLISFAKQHPERGGLAVDKRDNDTGRTALHWCMHDSNCSVPTLVTILKELKPTLTIKDNEGKTAADIAREYKRAKFIDALFGRAVGKGAEAAGQELAKYIETYAAEFTPASGNFYKGEHSVKQSLTFEEGICHPTFNKMRFKEADPQTSADVVTAITFPVSEVYDVLTYEWSSTLSMASLQMNDMRSKARRLFEHFNAYIQTGKFRESWVNQYMMYNDNTLDSIEVPTKAHAEKVKVLFKKYQAACST